MSDDYRDLSPRQKARMMEQNLEVHNQRRRALGLERPAQSIRTPWDRGVDDTPAPAFYRDDEGLVDPESRPPSWDESRRAARYRDGPPPPPPTAPLERQKLLKELERGHAFEQYPDDYPQTQQNRRPQRLVPPEVFEQMAGQSVSAPPITGYDPAFPEGSYTVQQPGQLAQPKLSPSQKRRLRRQKGRGQQQQARPAPYPLPQDAQPAQDTLPPGLDGGPPEPSSQSYQPVEPTHPEIPMHATCNTRATLIIDNHPVQFTCTMKPYPHTGQAHLVRLAATPDAPEVFLGWWGPGE